MKKTFLRQLSYWLTWVFDGYPELYALVMQRVMRMFPAPPGPPRVTLLNEGVNGMLNYSVGPPADTAPDVVSYNYLVKVDGQPDVTLTQVKGADNPTFGIATDGVNFTVQVAEVDDAGNVSDFSDAQSPPLVSKDTIAPPKPGQPAVALVSET